ncbi:Uma2 family endonuclease [Marinoscillum sp. 108]|uniref:Uma2 family endonuclease n=1 Tax=Marinoscillum sp. 108 TaxID=2653151 RepID=UPI0012F1C815|nr:Uma2 family endonuclease [Marinoscillum sp. 108]VXD18637.1 putative restriction endonuclease [Marinoscillum sp. 108]
MRNTLERPPKTVMEVYQSLPEGTLAELINNALYMSPSPTSGHQVVLNDINYELMSHFRETKTGMVLIAPLDVYLDEKNNAVQPDITVILNHNLSIVNESGHIHGVPDMLIEVLSPGNRDHDLIRKKDLYESFGVKEYWVVDPENKHALGYSFNKSNYELIGDTIGSIDSPLLKLKFTF